MGGRTRPHTVLSSYGGTSRKRCQLSARLVIQPEAIALSLPTHKRLDSDGCLLLGCQEDSLANTTSPGRDESCSTIDGCECMRSVEELLM